MEGAQSNSGRPSRRRVVVIGLVVLALVGALGAGAWLLYRATDRGRASALSGDLERVDGVASVDLRERELAGNGTAYDVSVHASRELDTAGVRELLDGVCAEESGDAEVAVMVGRARVPLSSACASDPGQFATVAVALRDLEGADVTVHGNWVELVVRADASAAVGPEGVRRVVADDLEGVAVRLLRESEPDARLELEATDVSPGTVAALEVLGPQLDSLSHVQVSGTDLIELSVAAPVEPADIRSTVRVGSEAARELEPEGAAQFRVTFADPSLSVSGAADPGPALALLESLPVLAPDVEVREIGTELRSIRLVPAGPAAADEGIDLPRLDAALADGPLADGPLPEGVSIDLPSSEFLGSFLGSPEELRALAPGLMRARADGYDATWQSERAARPPLVAVALRDGERLSDPEALRRAAAVARSLVADAEPGSDGTFLVALVERGKDPAGGNPQVSLVSTADGPAQEVTVTGADVAEDAVRAGWDATGE